MIAGVKDGVMRFADGAEEAKIRIHCPVLDVFAVSSRKSWLGW